MFRQVSIPIVTGTCLTYDNAYLSECWLTCLGTGVRSSHVRTYLASQTLTIIQGEQSRKKGRVNAVGEEDWTEEYWDETNLEPEMQILE